jgi:hypothetical protein
MAAPLVAVLSSVLWQTPYPISEAVAVFEDASRSWPPASFPVPDRPYYRPLFFMTVGAVLQTAGSLDAALYALKLVQILPVVLLVLLLVVHVRPRSLLDCAAAALAVAVLVGSPGFSDNIELPLSYTTLGMPIALAVWLLLNRRPSPLSSIAIVVLTLVAVGFKEQGLVVVPLGLVAWWTGAPGGSLSRAVALSALAGAYLGARLYWHGSWSMFEQATGFGFSWLEPKEAMERFGAFPFWLYAYNGASVVANVLFAEPSKGRFRILREASLGRFAPWQAIHLVSSVVLTALIVRWGLTAVKRDQKGWSTEGRVVLALTATLLACGVLGFNYSRPRLGGMAVPFYALSAYYAVRAAAARIAETSWLRFWVACLGLLLLSAAWQVRAYSTIEYARATALRNQQQWFTLLPDRRTEFADRPVYRAYLEALVEQGIAPDSPRPMRPAWIRDILVGP